MTTTQQQYSSNYNIDTTYNINNPTTTEQHNKIQDKQTRTTQTQELKIIATQLQHTQLQQTKTSTYIHNFNINTTTTTKINTYNTK